MWNCFIDESLANIAFFFVIKFVIWESRCHQTGFGDVQSDAVGIGRDPTSISFFIYLLELV
jgi:hypothetical protein